MHSRRGWILAVVCSVMGCAMQPTDEQAESVEGTSEAVRFVPGTRMYLQIDEGHTHDRSTIADVYFHLANSNGNGWPGGLYEMYNGSSDINQVYDLSISVDCRLPSGTTTYTRTYYGVRTNAQAWTSKFNACPNRNSVVSYATAVVTFRDSPPVLQ